MQSVARPIIPASAPFQPEQINALITVMAQTQNLLGRDAEIEWYAPGGEIQTENNGRIARVYFPDPGTYTVSAELFADGQQIRRDAVTIRVKPIN